MSTTKTGVSMGGVEVSSQRARQTARARRREEKRWAAKAGPVTIKFVCPVCGGLHARSDHPEQAA